MTLNKKLSLVLIAFAAVFCGACTSTREPVSMVEPSYSYMRDVQQRVTAQQTPANDLTAQAAPDDFSYTDDTDLESSIEPLSEQDRAHQQLLADHVRQLTHTPDSDFLFEMARLAPENP